MLVILLGTTTSCHPTHFLPTPSKHHGDSLLTSQRISHTGKTDFQAIWMSSELKIRRNNLLTEQTGKQPVWWMTRSQPMFLFLKKNIFVIWLVCVSHFEIFWDKHLNCEIEFHRSGESQGPHGSHLLLTYVADPSSSSQLSQNAT